MFPLARISLRPFDDRPDHVEEVAVRPVVGGDEGPEGDDGGVDVGVLPEAIGVGVHGGAEEGPFG